jgi:hypothetical protein
VGLGRRSIVISAQNVGEIRENCEPTMSNDPSCTCACRLPGGCGDGIVNGPEECDQGADKGVDGMCMSSCKTIIYLPP